MRLLILTARFPEYGYKGDQLRTRQLIELLGREHTLHVLSGGPPSSREALRDVQRLARVTVADPGLVARTLGALGSLARGRPAQVGWMAPRRLRQLAAAAAVDSDAVIASTVRVMFAPLAVPVIVDHIDALSANLHERSRLEPNPLLRLAASAEALLMKRHERSVSRWATALLLSTDNCP